MAGELDGDRGPVRADHLHDARELLLREGGAPLAGRGRGTVDDVLVDRAADQLAAPRAEQPEVGRVQFDLTALLVEQDHRVAGLLERAPEQRGPAGGARHAAESRGARAGRHHPMRAMFAALSIAGACSGGCCSYQRAYRSASGTALSPCANTEIPTVR